ncbi:hypothetical protein QSH57_008672 [Fusarium oxysporum f. sp. vasinfectum]|nr:hypothetical protein QSH57_008672 [Fusarium oxysporum f. sp. vasinfectum]
MNTADAYPNYLNASAVPMMLSLMTNFSNTTKRELCPSEDDLTPYMTYGYMPPMGFNAPSPYDQFNPYYLEIYVVDRAYRLFRSYDFRTTQPTT